MIVDQHQAVVEKYYGSGKMRSVIEHLLEECDRVVKNIINGWEEDRTMKRKVSFEHQRTPLWIPYKRVLGIKAHRSEEFDVSELFLDDSTASFANSCS
jgi:hypothetical protein